MKYSHILAFGVFTIVAPYAFPANAEGGFSAHPSVFPEAYRPAVENMSAEDKLALREYLDYEEREPCQNYQPVPNGFFRNGCYLDVADKPTEISQPVPVAAPAPEAETLRPVVKDYRIHFDHDKSAIRSSEMPTLDTVAEEIKTYEPYEVTIEGHADRSGNADYNIGLSQERAQSVSDALTEKGIPNRILDKEAYGESQPAVPTEDGVRLEANRRVEIQFRK